MIFYSLINIMAQPLELYESEGCPTLSYIITFIMLYYIIL